MYNIVTLYIIVVHAGGQIVLATSHYWLGSKSKRVVIIKTCTYLGQYADNHCMAQQWDDAGGRRWWQNYDCMFAVQIDFEVRVVCICMNQPNLQVVGWSTLCKFVFLWVQHITFKRDCAEWLHDLDLYYLTLTFKSHSLTHLVLLHLWQNNKLAGGGDYRLPDHLEVWVSVSQANMPSNDVRMIRYAWTTSSPTNYQLDKLQPNVLLNTINHHLNIRENTQLYL